MPSNVFETYKKWNNNAFFNFIDNSLEDLSFQDKLENVKSMIFEIKNNPECVLEVLNDILSDVEEDARTNNHCPVCGARLFVSRKAFSRYEEQEICCTECGYHEDN